MLKELLGLKKKGDGPRVICWDLDETLGDFRQLEHGSKEVTLREGMKEILESCKQKGIINVVTTSATEEYARLGLELTGIRGYIDAIFPFEKVVGWLGKKYSPVLEQYSISQKDAIDNVLVVGDTIKDRPLDIPGLVLLIDTTFPESAENIGKAIEKLTEEKSFKESYDKLFANSEPSPKGHNIYLGNGFSKECALAKGEYDADGKNIKINLIMFSKQK